MPEPEQPNQQPTKLLTRQELADLFGVEPGTITRWERDGMAPAIRAPRGQPSMFDPEVCQKWRDDVNAAKLLSQSGLSLEAERARLTRAQAEKVERENLRRAGELLPRDEVVRDGQAYTAAWSQKVRGIPRRLAQAGFITRDQEPAVAEICSEILKEIAGWKTLADVERVVSKKAAKRTRKKKKAAPPAASTPDSASPAEAPAP